MKGRLRDFKMHQGHHTHTQSLQHTQGPRQWKVAPVLTSAAQRGGRRASQCKVTMCPPHGELPRQGWLTERKTNLLFVSSVQLPTGFTRLWLMLSIISLRLISLVTTRCAAFGVTTSFNGLNGRKQILTPHEGRQRLRRGQECADVSEARWQTVLSATQTQDTGFCHSTSGMIEVSHYRFA